jgi:hypothetical protein
VHDYAYSRHIVDVAARRVYAYTLETGQEFQPADAEAGNIITEVSAGLTEFCVACLCVVETTAAFTQADTGWLDRLRRLRDTEMVKSGAGRRYLSYLQRHSGELLQIAMKRSDARTMALDALRRVADGARDSSVLDPEVLRTADRLLDVVAETAGATLRETVAEIRKDLPLFEGKTIADGLVRASEREKARPSC